MAAVNLLVVGDIAWDIVLRPEGDLIWGSDVFGAIELLPGGSAANVAVWARRLGAAVTLAGKVGEDALGELIRRHLEAEAVALEVRAVPSGVTTRVGVYVRADGEHAFVTDHTRAVRFEEGDLPMRLLEGVDALFVNGYAVFMSGSAEFLTGLLREARRRGVRIAFDPSSFALIRRYGAQRLLAELGPIDMLLANDDEARALAGDRDAATLVDAASLVVVKHGPAGASAFDGTRRVSAPAVPVRVVDTTGAGDAFDAAFLVGYLYHGDLDLALAEANRLGAHVAGRLGGQAR